MGDFERCLELCGAIAARDAGTISQLALLKARALLRLGRADDALGELARSAASHPSRDALATALMLTAAAEIRLGRHARGLELLDEARALPGTVHATIRSEIALTAALAYFGLRSLGEAQQQLELVAPDSDIVYARALEYRGWIETVRADYDGATHYFGAALEQLDTCRHSDRFLEANALMVLALFAAERFDSKAWEAVAERIRGFDWSRDGLAESHYRISVCASIVHEFSGDLRAAMRFAAQAEACAGGDAYKATSYLRRAEIARGNGDSLPQLAYLDQAELSFERAAVSALGGDELYVALTMAEELALAGEHTKAERVLHFYRASERPSAMLSGSSDVRREGFERMAEAHVCAVGGDEPGALRGFLDAFAIFARIGYKRRATIAALRLAQLTRGGTYAAYAADATADLSPGFWMHRAARAAQRADDPLAQRLTALERATLALVCEGRTNKEIAAAQARSYYTVRNMVSDLLERFEVPNRKRLIALCRERGVVAPGRVTD